MSGLLAGERTLGDSLQFLPEHLWDVSVQFVGLTLIMLLCSIKATMPVGIFSQTNPELFDYYTAVTHQWNQTVLTVHVWLRTLTAVRMSTYNASMTSNPLV